MKEQEPYKPDIGLSYPADPFEHMQALKKEVEITVDKDYPFLDKSLKFILRSWMVYLGIFTLVFILIPIRFGLRIRGRGILRKHRRLFRNGVMSVSNHVLRWDFLCVLKALRYRRMYFPAWKENLCGPDRYLIRAAGGIPVPDDIHTMKYFNLAFDEIHRKKKWIHVFPESARWDYFQPIRPFKKGVFTLAYRYNLPVLPLAFSYREPRGWWKLLNRLRKKNLPSLTLTIGEPILPDLSRPRKEESLRLRKECHRRIVELAGITGNPYPAEGD